MTVCQLFNSSNINHRIPETMHQNKASTSTKSSIYTAFPSAERIASLKELMELEEQRSGLEGSLQVLQERIDTIQGDLFSLESRHVRSRLGEMRRSRFSSRRRMARGELRAQILQQLETAGTEGVNVHAIAARLGMKAVNIHSWFHTALKRFPQIRKSGPSHYHLNQMIRRPLWC
jgi:chromosome segregation ATPase